MKDILIKALIAIGIYFAIRQLGGEIGRTILYPVNLLVTFLHEFGHGLGAIFTGGKVSAIQINTDGSGFCRSIGGVRSIILMGGYLGSAVFGNLLLYIGLTKENWSKYVVYLLAFLMAFTGLIWFNSISSTAILILFALVFVFISKKTPWSSPLLTFLGLASVFFIIEDFNVGPSSDLTQYAKEMVILPKVVWMYSWLFFALIITAINLRFIYKSGTKKSSPVNQEPTYTS